MDDKKPRTQYIYRVTKGKVSQLELTVDTGTGEISFGPNVGNTYSETSYERSKKPKVLSRPSVRRNANVLDGRGA